MSFVQIATSCAKAAVLVVVGPLLVIADTICVFCAKDKLTPSAKTPSHDCDDFDSELVHALLLQLEVHFKATRLMDPYTGLFDYDEVQRIPTADRLVKLYTRLISNRDIDFVIEKPVG